MEKFVPKIISSFYVEVFMSCLNCENKVHQVFGGDVMHIQLANNHRASLLRIHKEVTEHPGGITKETA